MRLGRCASRRSQLRGFPGTAPTSGFVGVIVTSEYSNESGGRTAIPVSLRRFGRLLLFIGTSLLLAITFWFHPHAHGNVADTLMPVIDTWLTLHLALLPLLGLLGVCFAVLLRGYTGLIVTVGRIGTVVYLVGYITFEAIVGIATGILLREAGTLPPNQQEGVEVAVQAFFDAPVTGIVPLVTLIGTLGAVVSVASIAILLRRSGAPLIPVACLGGVPVALVAHGTGSIDVLGMVLFAAGIAWLELGWSRPEGR